jgi:hypothetical protein
VIEEGQDVGAAAPRVRRSWAISANPAGRPRRSQAIKAIIMVLARRGSGSRNYTPRF